MRNTPPQTSKSGICLGRAGGIAGLRGLMRVAHGTKGKRKTVVLKVWDDFFLPHILRDYSQYKPRDIVEGDVRPVDIMMTRAPCRHEIDLWSAALAPLESNLKAALASWLRVSAQKPPMLLPAIVRFA